MEFEIPMILIDQRGLVINHTLVELNKEQLLSLFHKMVGSGRLFLPVAYKRILELNDLS